MFSAIKWVIWLKTYKQNDNGKGLDKTTKKEKQNLHPGGKCESGAEGTERNWVFF